MDAVPPDKRFGHTAIDVLINAEAESMSLDTATLLVAAIEEIEEKCRGRSRSETGFFS
jgi:hypothetical protein